MKQFIEVTREAGPICVTLPPRRLLGTYAPVDITLHVHREGVRNLLAKYPSAHGESGQLCFAIDDDLIEAKPGWYVGVVYECNRPIHTFRMYVPRPKFGAASVARIKYETTCDTDDCDPNKDVSSCNRDNIRVLDPGRLC